MEFGFNKNKKPVLFDLNPRIGASFAVHRKIGINLPFLALSLLKNKDFKPKINLLKLNQKFYRYFSNVWTKS